MAHHLQTLHPSPLVHHLTPYIPHPVVPPISPFRHLVLQFSSVGLPVQRNSSVLLFNRHDLSYQEIVYRHSRSAKYLAHSEREQSYDWQICPKNTRKTLSFHELNHCLELRWLNEHSILNVFDNILHASWGKQPEGGSSSQ